MFEKGDIYYANLINNQYNSHIQNGIRPVVILSNNVGNKYSPTLIVAPLTSQIKKTNIPTHIVITKDKYNLLKMNSMILLEQIITINKTQLYTRIGTICDEDLHNINKGLKISLDL